MIRDTALQTARFTASLFVIFIGAMLFARFLTLSGFTSAVAEAVLKIGLPGIGLVLVMIFVYLVLGCFLDSVSSMAIVLPIIFDPLKSLGVNPIWFGVLTVYSLSLGKITPPMGMDVFAVRAVAGDDVTVEGIFRACVPFLIMCLAILVILILFPQISLFLPNQMT
jgi:TRAP-type C4-dicarboxylate transport system permease large subunit